MNPDEVERYTALLADAKKLRQDALAVRLLYPSGSGVMSTLGYVGSALAVQWLVTFTSRAIQDLEQALGGRRRSFRDFSKYKPDPDNGGTKLLRELRDYGEFYGEAPEENGAPKGAPSMTDSEASDTHVYVMTETVPQPEPKDSLNREQAESITMVVAAVTPIADALIRQYDATQDKQIAHVERMADKNHAHTERMADKDHRTKVGTYVFAGVLVALAVGSSVAGHDKIAYALGTLLAVVIGNALRK